MRTIKTLFVGILAVGGTLGLLSLVIHLINQFALISLGIGLLIISYFVGDIILNIRKAPDRKSWKIGEWYKWKWNN